MENHKVIDNIETIKEDENNIFYCYSKKLSYFIQAFGINHGRPNINKQSNCKYYPFVKSERLDKIIELYNNVKHSI